MKRGDKKERKRERKKEGERERERGRIKRFRKYRKGGIYDEN